MYYLFRLSFVILYIIPSFSSPVERILLYALWYGVVFRSLSNVEECSAQRYPRQTTA